MSPWSAAEEGRAGEDGARGGRAELWARLDELEREEEVFLREEEEKEEERAARGGWRRAGTGVVAGAANRRSSEQPLSGKLSRGAEGRRDGDPAPASITFTHSHDDAGREEEEEERRKVVGEGERRRGDRVQLLYASMCAYLSPPVSSRLVSSPLCLSC